MIGIIQAVVFLSSFWVIAPRIMRRADARLTRSRLTSANSRDPAPRAPHRTRRIPQPVSIADGLDALGRTLRIGTTPRDAVTAFLDSTWPDADIYLDDSLNLESALHTCAQHAHAESHHALSMLASASVGGALSVEAIEHAATIERMRMHMGDEARTAASQARLSVRVLTFLPVGALALLILRKGAGTVLTSGGFVIVIGLALNLFGARWAGAMTRRAVTGPSDPIGALVTSLAVSLRAGLDPVSACVRWRDVNDVGRLVADRIESHTGLIEALRPLADHSPRGSHAASMIIDSVATGLPLSAIASRIVDQSVQDERRAIDTRVRQLPVRLTAPIVLCILPSFILLAIVPMIISAFPHGITGVMNAS